MGEAREIKIKLFENEKLISVEGEASPADMGEITGVLMYEICKTGISKGMAATEIADLLHQFVDMACQRAKADSEKSAEA